MKTIDLPWSTRLRTTPKNSSTSPGVSTAVGSSRMRMSASRNSALSSSTRCCSPTERSSTMASGSTREPVLLAELADAAAGGVEVEHRPAAQLVAEHDVLGDREHRDQLEVLVHHADAARRSRRHELRELDGLAVERGSRRRRAGRARRSRSSACVLPAPFSPRRQCTSPSVERRSRRRRWRGRRGTLGDAARLEDGTSRRGSVRRARHRHRWVSPADARTGPRAESRGPLLRTCSSVL